MCELLILTNSYDTTTDLLLDRLDGSSVLRVNFDQITRYKFRLDSQGFKIQDSIGRTAASSMLKKAYWRKPFGGSHSEQAVWTSYIEAEMRYVLSEFVNCLWAEQKLVLVEPFAERRTGKWMQLQRAGRRFSVPDYEIVLNRTAGQSPAIVKSLSSEPLDNGVLYTTQVQPGSLDTRYPWFVQQYIPATHDVTVVFVRGRLFSFSLSRDFLSKTVDWRELISPEQRWMPHHLPTHVRNAIQVYMHDLKLAFGRFDFLLDEEGCYWFCEVNPNGQYAWLDLTGAYGLLDAVAEEISPSTKCNPIPNKHPLHAGLRTADRRAAIARKFAMLNE